MYTRFGAVGRERERERCELVQKERERVCVCLTKNVRRNKNDTCARLYSKEERKDESYFNDDECNFESERRD